MKNDGAAGLLELVDQVPEMAARLGIEAGGGLVEKQQLRIADQRAGHGQALLLPAREPADAGAALLFKLRGADGLIDGDAAAKKAAKQAQRLFYRELFRKLRLLELNADALAKFVGAGAPVQAEQLDCAFVGLGESLADFDGGGLPCPVRTKQAEALAGRDLEVEPVHGLHVGKRLPQAANQQRRACRRPDFGMARSVRHRIRLPYSCCRFVNHLGLPIGLCIWAP